MGSDTRSRSRKRPRAKPLNKRGGDFPGGPVVKNPPANPRRFHVPWSNQAHEPRERSLRPPEPVLCNKWTGRPGVLRFMGSQRVGHD